MGVAGPRNPRSQLGLIQHGRGRSSGAEVRAKVRGGRPDGARFVACLDLLARAVDSGKVILPLGLTHYTEVANITDVRQRADIANAMAGLSGFITLAARKHRLRCEVAQALHQRLGRPLFPERLQPFGRGFAFAMGVGDGPAGRIGSVGGAPLTTSAPYRAELEFRLNQAAEYLLLRGPAPEDLVAMPDYDIGPVEAIAEARAAREQELFELLKTDPADKRRLGDIASARVLGAWPAAGRAACPGRPIGRVFLLQRKGLDHLLSQRGPCPGRADQPRHADEQERDPGLDEERRLRHRRTGSSRTLLRRHCHGKVRLPGNEPERAGRPLFNQSCPPPRRSRSHPEISGLKRSGSCVHLLVGILVTSSREGSGPVFHRVFSEESCETKVGRKVSRFPAVGGQQELVIPSAPSGIRQSRVCCLPW